MSEATNEATNEVAIDEVQEYPLAAVETAREIRHRINGLKYKREMHMVKFLGFTKLAKGEDKHFGYDRLAKIEKEEAVNLTGQIEFCEYLIREIQTGTQP
jgi:hypothetical protein